MSEIEHNKTMKKIILINLCLVSLCTFSQESNIFLISGTPFAFEKYMPKNPVIYCYNKINQLDTISLLTNNDNSIIKFLNVYPELNLLVSYEETFEKNKKKYFSFVDLNHPKEIKVNEIDYPDETIESNLLCLPDNTIYYCLDFAGKKFLGISLEMKEKEFYPNDFNYAYITGESGGSTKSVEFLLLYKEKSDNKLHISKGFGQSIGPLYNFQPPDSLLSGIKGLVSAAVNNKNALVIWLDETDPSKAKTGNSKILILNKRNNEWYKYKIYGNYLSMRGFGEWLTGEVVAKNAGSYFKSRGTYSSYNYGKNHPGFVDRKRSTGIWGEVFDDRAETFGNYYTGILYLLNVSTLKYIEWNTNQGDSEILLVQDEIVYYRVNDKIFKAPIIEGSKLGKIELMVQDKRVPDIHWAFISKN